MTTKQQEKLYELSEFLQHYLSANDYDKAMSILNEMLVYLKSDVMDYIKEMMLKDLNLDEGAKKSFIGLIRLTGRKP